LPHILGSIRGHNIFATHNLIKCFLTMSRVDIELSKAY
jgi:hypothetical protein